MTSAMDGARSEGYVPPEAHGRRAGRWAGRRTKCSRPRSTTSPPLRRRSDRGQGRRGDDARFLAGGQSLIPMMKMRLASPGEARRHQPHPRPRHARPENGHLRVGALVRHADIVALRPRLRRGRVGRAVDLRPAGTQPRHDVRVDRPLRPRGRLELGAARDRRRRRRTRPPASGRSRSPTSSPTCSPTRSPTTRWSPRCASTCQPGASGGRTRSSSARSATTRRSRSPPTSSSRPTADRRGPGSRSPSVTPVNTKVTAAEALLVGQQPSDELFAEAGELAAQASEPRDDVRGTAEWKRNVVRVFTRGGRWPPPHEQAHTSMTERQHRGGHRHDQRHGSHARRRAAHAARRLHSHERRAHRHAHRLRHDELRRVHGLARRHAGEVVHGARGAGRRPVDHDRRGTEAPNGVHPIQAAFKEEHGLQCGFCTPAMMLVGGTARAEPDPSDDDVRWAISGNICRCTGYMNIVKAIQRGSRRLGRPRR